MAKDPAVLFYPDKWLTATKSMRADAKGWYLNLILFQFELTDLPNDIEELANLCDVRISEFEHFKQVFEQVLKHKFKQNENGRLENEIAKEIIQKRKRFIEKRSNAGKMSYFIKFGIKHFKLNKKQIEFIKDNTDIDNIDLKNEQVLKQVFEQKLELYINENENEDKDEDVIEIIYPFDSEKFMKFWDLWKQYKKEQFKFVYKPIGEQGALKNLSELSKGNEKKALRIIEQSISKGWKGFFDLTDNSQINDESMENLLSNIYNTLSNVGNS